MVGKRGNVLHIQAEEQWALTGHTPRWITAITHRVTEALAVLTLNGSLGCSVRVHRDSETAERRYGAHLVVKGSTIYRHNEVRCWKPVLSRIGISAALRAEGVLTLGPGFSGLNAVLFRQMSVHPFAVWPQEQPWRVRWLSFGLP
jgi:hypothetical protein